MVNYNCSDNKMEITENEILLSMTVEDEKLNMDSTNIITLNITNMSGKDIDISINSFKLQLTSSLTGTTQVFILDYSNEKNAKNGKINVNGKGTFSLKSDLAKILSHYEISKNDSLPGGDYSIRIILDDMDISNIGSINSNVIYLEV